MVAVDHFRIAEGFRLAMCFMVADWFELGFKFAVNHCMIAERLKVALHFLC